MTKKNNYSIILILINYLGKKMNQLYYYEYEEREVCDDTVTSFRRIYKKLGQE